MGFPFPIWRLMVVALLLAGCRDTNYRFDKVFDSSQLLPVDSGGMTDIGGKSDSTDSGSGGEGCESNFDCPGGICALSKPGTTNPRPTACVDGSLGKGAGGTCEYNSDCASNGCYLSLGLCLDVCTSTHHCNFGWNCFDSGFGPMCFPMMDADECPEWAAQVVLLDVEEFGAYWRCDAPVGAEETGQSCELDDECRSGLCMSGYCLGPCKATSDCPDGFSCKSWFLETSNGAKRYFNGCGK